jgi:hypothetical protein
VVRAQFLIDPYKFEAAAAGGGDSPGTTSLVAWYDFDDTNDAHASYDLAETGTVTYDSGVATIGASGQLQNSAVDNNWGQSDADRTFAIRFQGDAGAANGYYPFYMNDGRVSVRWYETGGALVRMNNVSLNIGDNFVEDTWYLVIARYNATTDDMDVLVNGAAPTVSTTNMVHSTTGGNLRLPDTGGQPFSYDFLLFYDRRLSDAECEWLYNDGATRVYSDL